jgi:hypothetical protein
MIEIQKRSASSLNFLLRSSFLCVLLMLAFAGCNRSGHTSDPHLRQIDELLDSQLPQGTAKSRVVFFLSSQGFPLESTRDPKAIVVIIHRVDTDTLQPETARVTFHFDASDKLKSYELDSVTGSTVQP